VSTEDGSLQWVARAGYVERPKSGSVRGSGCNSPDLLGSPGWRVVLEPKPIRKSRYVET
jgi:hypothetical protein